MKIEFKDLNFDKIFQKSAIFLYGNYNEVGSVFFDAIVQQYKSVICKDFENQQIDVVRQNASLFFKNIQNAQESLFKPQRTFYYIHSLEDTHIDHLNAIINQNDTSFYLFFESGEYIKSKKITQWILQNPKIVSVPTFNSAQTLQSIAQFFVPGLDPITYKAIAQYLQYSTQGPYSDILKLQLCNKNEISNFAKTYLHPKSFLQDLESIALSRYLSSQIIKNIDNIKQIIANTLGCSVNLNTLHSLRFLQKIEILVKKNILVSQSFIYQHLLNTFTEKRK